MRDALRACDSAINEALGGEELTNTNWRNLRTAQDLARQAVELNVDSNTELLAACRAARDLYERLSLARLEGAPEQGADHEPPTDEECLAVRRQLLAATTGF